jgi:ParB-like chromosome segregation protein Spo0J
VDAEMTTETLTYRDRTYRRHPLSALFPVIVGEEFESLKASIHESGLRQAILLAGEGSDAVLDGWNRLRGCIATDSAARFEYAPPDADLIKISLDLNLSRRHLTAGQKAMIAAEIANVHSGFRVDRASAAPVGTPFDQGFDVSGHQPRPDPDEVPPGSPISESPHRISESSTTNEQGTIDSAPVVSLGQAAERLGIARSTAALGRRIATQGDESVKDAVRSGAIALNEAGELLKQPKDAQRAHMQKRLAEGREFSKAIQAGAKQTDKFAQLLRACKPLPADASPAQRQSAALRFTELTVIQISAAIYWASDSRNVFDTAQRQRIRIAMQHLNEAFMAADAASEITP